MNDTNITKQTLVRQLSKQTVSQEELIRFVDDAAAYARVNGREKAIAAFHDPDSSFVKGDLYIFAVDYNGTSPADIWDPEHVGQDISSMTDPFGVKTVQRLAETARFNKGYVGYNHENFPLTSGNSTRSIPKLVFIKAVDDTWRIGTGVCGVEVKL